MIVDARCFINLQGQAVLDIDTDTGTYRFDLKDAHQILDIADMLRVIGYTMLRDAPRPKQCDAASVEACGQLTYK